MQQSFRVLLVEDDDSLRVCLGEFLADHGWDVGLAASGPEAIELALRQRFDFSILDFHLPNGTTGLDVFRRLCALRPLPAILMSGAANRDEATLALQAGIFTFLRKPLDLDRLRQSVHLLISHHFGGPLGFPVAPVQMASARPIAPALPRPRMPRILRRYRPQSRPPEGPPS
jgi:DNA-binding NtrC family response regulator